MRRPLDGYWDLIHEKRGSMAAAHTIMVVACIVEVVRLVLSNFQFINVNLEFFSAWWAVGGMVVPVLLWSVANWMLTTLFDGKGRIRDIYMGMAYAHAPLIIINIILVPLSHIITYDEGAIYWVMSTLATFWFMLLVVCAMKEIHDYSFGKAVLTSLLTIVAIGVLVFIGIMFFAVISDGFAYFYSIGQEILFRVQG
jgi:hypothetical protein